MGMDLKPLTINNIFTSFFSNHENSSPLHMTQLPLPRFWEVLSTGDIVAEGNKKREDFLLSSVATNGGVSRMV